MGNSKTGRANNSTSASDPATTDRKSASPSDSSHSFAIRSEPSDLPENDSTADAHKYEATIGESPNVALRSGVPAFEDLGALPSGYGTNTLYLVARDPSWFFLYWDVDWNTLPKAGMLGGILKVFLKLHRPDERDVLTTEVKAESRNWYLQIPAPARTYYAELGYFDADGKWAVVAKSEEVLAPSDRISDSGVADFATLPLHLSFEHVLGMVRGAQRPGEPLVETLARLQREARDVAVSHQKRTWTEEERYLIGSILGDAVSSGGLSSAELVERLRLYIEQKLSSESASELMAKLVAEAGSSEVSSGIFARYLSEKLSSETSSEIFALLLKESLSSQTSSEVLSRLKETLSSLGSSELLALLSAETLSSGGSGGLGSLGSLGAQGALSSGFSSEFLALLRETLTSGGSSELWATLLAESLSSETSSGLFARILGERLSSETSSAIFAAFLSERLSSQSASELLAKGLFWPAETSSLFSGFGAFGAFGSWGAFGSETMALLKAVEAFSSWENLSSDVTSWNAELGSSWSGQPTQAAGAFSAAVDVNAEVIFYGGADPKARLLIDGKPVALTPDGSFRCHFRFQNADQEVPIVAISPDGVQRRVATLRLDRQPS